MLIPILATKLYTPPPPPKSVFRAHLIEQLNEGLHRKLTLISAPAGFGKTTLLSEWIADCECPVAWLSLDEGDNDPHRFLAYLVGALQTITAHIGAGVLGALQLPQPPPPEVILTALLNDIAAIPDNFVLVLDDYHVIESQMIDNALIFLIKHLPPRMHLVIATREDPHLPLAQLRVRGQLSELRVTDLRFTQAEAAEFLNQVMGLSLSGEAIGALETRTEGWIAGLQLAALSMQGHQDTSRFIQSFTGSHHFVMDYLVEEVLQQQPETVQTFLLHTSILNRLCGSLCDAVLGDTAGQETLAYLERANLFIIPLDNERRWYRYHHLFADLLRQRLNQSLASSIGDTKSYVNELHVRASQWYEDNGLEIEAFHHAAAAHDIERAERLIDGKGIPLHLRGAVTAIIDWLESLPKNVMNARPMLWWRHASMLLVNGHTTGVAEKLDAAEAALPDNATDEKTRHFIGQIATARAVLALTRYEAETMITQSYHALEYLSPNNLTLRANANWTLGVAYVIKGDLTAARRVLNESILLSQKARDIFTTILATMALGQVHEVENQLYQAAEIYQRILQLAGDQPLQIINEAHLGLARILYEWNDLDGAEQHGRQSLQLARQYDKVIDRFILSEVFLAWLKLAQVDVAGAAAILAQASQSVRQQNFVHRVADVAAAQVLVLLHQGNLAAAAHLAQVHELPISQVRVALAQGDTSTALALLETIRQQVEGLPDQRLKVMILQAIALDAHGERDRAVEVLHDALRLAEPEGFIRSFVDEGLPMAHLLSAIPGIAYVDQLLGVLRKQTHKYDGLPEQPQIEPLSQRELEVLQLVAQGLSNREISDRLFLALDTVKGHNRKIFDKLQVQRRTEAIARARELGLL